MLFPNKAIKIVICSSIIAFSSPATADTVNYLLSASHHQGQSNSVQSPSNQHFSFGDGNSIKFGALFTQQDSPWRTTLGLAYKLNEVDTTPNTTNKLETVIIDTILYYELGPLHIGGGPTLHLNNVYTVNSTSLSSKTRLDKRMGGKVSIGLNIGSFLTLEIAHEKVKYTSNGGIGLFTFSNGTNANRVSADNTSASLTYIF